MSRFLQPKFAIATKVCNPIGSKWNAVFESHVVPSVDRTSFNYPFEDFLASCLCKQSYVTGQPSITESLCLPLAILRGTEPISALTYVLFILLCSLYFFSSWISSVAISPWQGFNSEHEHLTSTVLEHLESGQGPGLGQMCWPGAWVWL